jgi:flagellar hook-associated protein 1 FlgK
MEKAMGVVQNNVTNASTPGYVTQTLSLTSSAFDPSAHLWGGLQSAGVQSARDMYSEQAVWSANQQVGAATAQATGLQNLESVFSVSGTSGIPAALNGLISAFSAWSESPDSATARQQIISAAQSLIESFNEASSSVQQISSQTDQQLQSTIGQINQLASQIAALNGQIRNGGQQDGGLNAQLYNNLEQLSSLVPIQVELQADGTATVLMDGQTPLVIGQTAQAIHLGFAQPAAAVNPLGSPDAQILDSNGQNVTDTASGGHLGGLLQLRNSVLPSVIGDGNQQGSLNQLAQAVADAVNGLLTSGQVISGVGGTALFSYAPSSPTQTAATLTLNPVIAASQLAAIQPGPPPVANGIANQLAQLGTTPLTGLGGVSSSDFYSALAAGIGTLAASASNTQQTETTVLTQAQNLRSQLSGVSLNEQAANLLQFQQTYQASAEAISRIGSTLQFLMTAMQQVS